MEEITSQLREELQEIIDEYKTYQSGIIQSSVQKKSLKTYSNVYQKKTLKVFMRLLKQLKNYLEMEIHNA